MHFSELDDRITPGCLVKVIPVRPQAMSKKFRDLLHISHTKVMKTAQRLLQS